MRTEQEMLDLILNIAKKDERIRIVGLNGSRTNIKIPKDIFQDFDIVYIVTDVKSFVEDKNWIDIFGNRIIMQIPESLEANNRFTYLMLFADGNRIDLRLIPFKEKDIYLTEDKLTMILLDKDNCLNYNLLASDEDYHVKCPSYKIFNDCCNEFWWVSTYIAKGLWRKEILYANYHIEECVRPMLIRMLEWEVGIKTNFNISTGKCNKYLKQYLTNKQWENLLCTYSNSNYTQCWHTLFSMSEMFCSTSKYVAQQLNFLYKTEEADNVKVFLKHIHQLPCDAKDFLKIL